MNIYNKFRPKTFKNFIGNDVVVKNFRKTFTRKNPPNSAIISGSFGLGKTTLVRIIKNKLEIHDNDYREMNLASVTGIDNVREIEQDSKNRPLFSNYKIYVLDECQKLSKNALDALLKVIEDCPSFCIFFFCTTEPEKIPKGIQSRCCKFELKPLSLEEIEIVLSNAASKLDYELTEEIIAKIYEWDYIDISNFKTFYKAYLPKDLILAILELYKNKTELKGVAEKIIEYFVSKGMLNAVYGMSVTDPCKDENIYF